MANKEKLIETLAHVQATYLPGYVGPTHDQAHWAEKTSCGTSYCMAGWAVEVSGAKFEWKPSEPDENGFTSVAWDARQPGSDKDVAVKDLARNLLGLNPLHAEMLFLDSMTLDEVYTTVAHILDMEQPDLENEVHERAWKLLGGNIRLHLPELDQELSEQH